MDHTDQLVEQQILRYQSHQKHLDEMVEKARKALENHPEREKHAKTLDEILKRRDELQVRVEEMALKNPSDPEEEVEKAGLMAPWEVLAQDLEKLLESLGV